MAKNYGTNDYDDFVRGAQTLGKLKELLDRLYVADKDGTPYEGQIDLGEVNNQYELIGGQGRIGIYDR